MKEGGANVCTCCGSAKPLSEFYKDSRRADGYRTRCKPCMRRLNNAYRDSDAYRAHMRAYRANNAERAAGYNRTYRERNPGMETENTRNWRARYPLKNRAHRAVWNEIRRGRMQKQPCEVCGETRAEAHHDDYNKPLDVRWLCKKHHAEAHVAIAAAIRATEGGKG